MRAQGRASRVEVTVDSADTTPRDRLGWLQPAPVWKTAWRAVDGPDGLALTGWAVVENTTGHDWDDVSLTLATGAVRALDARLYDRVDAPREKAPQFAPWPKARWHAIWPMPRWSKPRRSKWPKAPAFPPTHCQSR